MSANHFSFSPRTNINKQRKKKEIATANMEKADAQSRSHVVVGIDMDDVLVPHNQIMVDWYNERFKDQRDPITLDHLSDYNFSKAFKTTKEDAWQIYCEFTGSKTWDLIHDEYSGIEGSLAVLDTARNSFDGELKYVVVTARHDKLMECTKRFIERAYPHLFEDVVCCGTYIPTTLAHQPQNSSQLLSKANVCKDMNISLLIDDYPNHVKECQKVGVDGVLFGHYPWNKHVTDITRMVEWGPDMADMIISHAENMLESNKDT